MDIRFAELSDAGKKEVFANMEKGIFPDVIFTESEQKEMDEFFDGLITSKKRLMERVNGA